MQSLFIVGAVIVILAAYYVSGALGNLANPTQLPAAQQATSTQATTTKTTIESSQKTVRIETAVPSFQIETYITSGPQEGEIINTTNKITFEFKGATTPLQNSKISFETKVLGLDSIWQSTDSGNRTITFSSQSKEYTFLVRAKVKGFVDQTPATRKFTIAVSPYFGKVKVSSVSHSTIVLFSNLGENETIDVTGWKIKGRGGEIIIPQGADIYIPTVSPLQDVFIKKSDQIYIQSSSNPFKSNLAFRPNRCFGYLREAYGSSFPFSYSKICPAINRDEICYFSQNCQNLVTQLQSCNRINYSKNLQILYDSTCQAYIENYISRYLNYDGCIQNYFKDSNFLEKRWYVYAGFDILCKCSDTLYLYDKNGLLIDRYDYKIY